MKILIVRVSAIGDVVHTLPAIFLIKKNYPQAQISWVVQKKVSDLILEQPFLEEAFVLNDKFLHPQNILSTMRILKKIRNTKWDAILDFQGIHKTSILIAFLKGNKFGFEASCARSSISTWFNSFRISCDYKNIVQKNLCLASFAIQTLFDSKQCPSIEALKKEFYLEFKIQNKMIVDKWLQQNGIQDFVLICPNTTWKTKHWPEENWIEFVKMFKKFCKQDLLLVGSELGRAAKNVATILKRQEIEVKLVPPLGLNSMAYLVSKADLLIAPDTGLLHLADFLNIKTIGIFGPTKKEVVGPFFNKDNIKNAIQVYEPDQWNLKKATKAPSKMYKLNPEILLDKTKESLK